MLLVIYFVHFEVIWFDLQLAFVFFLLTKIFSWFFLINDKCFFVPYNTALCFIVFCIFYGSLPVFNFVFIRFAFHFFWRIFLVRFWCCLFMFWFLIVENLIPNILKLVFPDSHHWFIELYFGFWFCQSFQNFQNIFWKSCLRIEVFAFQYHLPIGFVFLICNVGFKPPWSDRLFGNI